MTVASVCHLQREHVGAVQGDMEGNRVIARLQDGAFVYLLVAHEHAENRRAGTPQRAVVHADSGAEVPAGVCVDKGSEQEEKADCMAPQEEPS
jgi:hypothetical protein